MNRKFFALLPLLVLALCIIFPLAHDVLASDKQEVLYQAQEDQWRYDGELAQPEPREDTGAFTLTAQVTAYCPCVICCDEYSAEHPNNIGTDFVQLTASGTVPATSRTIAVDPNVIPIGSYVMIGNAVYVAEDTGSFIDGSDIDIFMSSHERARQFGTKKMDVTVYTPEHFVLRK